MRRTLAVLAIIAGSAALAEENPIAGTYGDEGGCRRLAGESEGSDLVFILTPDRIERYESSCAISHILLDGGVPVQADVTCDGEGETWTDSYIMSPLAGEDGYLIGPADAPDIRFEVRPCD